MGELRGSNLEANFCRNPKITEGGKTGDPTADSNYRHKETIWCYVKNGDVTIDHGGSGYSVGDKIKLKDGAGELEVTSVDQNSAINSVKVLNLHADVKNSWNKSNQEILKHHEKTHVVVQAIGGAAFKIRTWDYCEPLPQSESAPAWKPIWDGSSCRKYTLSDCDSKRPYLNEHQTACRPASTSEECNEGQKFVSPAKGCVSYTEEDCDHPRLFVSGKVGCRKWIKEDCDNEALFISEKEGCCDEWTGPRGTRYRGCQDRTTEGIQCEPWKSASEEAGESLDEAWEHNYCRNPGGIANGIWCYAKKEGTLQKLQCSPKTVVYRASDCRDPKLFLGATTGCRSDFEEADCDGTSTPVFVSKEEGCRLDNKRLHGERSKVRHCDENVSTFRGSI